jgi:hypothetical protein
LTNQIRIDIKVRSLVRIALSKAWILGAIGGGAASVIIAILVFPYLQINLTADLSETILNGTLALTGILIAVVGILLSIRHGFHPDYDKDARNVMAILIAFTVSIMIVGLALVFSSFLHIGNEIYRQVTERPIILLFIMMIMMIITIVATTVAYLIKKG